MSDIAQQLIDTITDQARQLERADRDIGDQAKAIANLEGQIIAQIRRADEQATTIGRYQRSDLAGELRKANETIERLQEQRKNENDTHDDEVGRLYGEIEQLRQQLDVGRPDPLSDGEE